MAKKHRRRRRRRNWGRTMLLLVFTAAALYAGVHCIFRAPETPGTQNLTTVSAHQEDGSKGKAESGHTARKESFYTILLSGVDDDNGGSDTNILVAVDVKGKKIHGVSIARDTLAIVQGKRHKINFAYKTGGVDLLAQTLSDQLGIPVDYTVKVDLRGFEALVDAIGGVDFNVPIRMNYDDPFQNLSIHFQPGMQHLNGKEALKVVRFRHNNDGTGYGTEDLGRMKTQQDFLKTVAAQTLQLSNLDKVKEFSKIFQDSVETDLTLGNLAWLGKKAISIGSENITFSTLPGEWKSPFIRLDQEEVLQVVNDSLNPYVEDRTMEDLNIPS